jgi:hypothetical protein
VGKLFERIEANTPAGHDKRYRNNILEHTSAFSEFLPTPRKPAVQGAFRSAGRISFVTFLWTSKKSKGENRLIRYDVTGIPVHFIIGIQYICPQNFPRTVNEGKLAKEYPG